MTKSQIKQTVENAQKQLQVCNAYFRYDAYYWNLIPLKSSDKLFLSIKEDDFILNGYTIRRFKDVNKIKTKADKCDEILKLEKVTDNINIPNIDISNWKTVFESLKIINKNIIVEKESLIDREWEFVIGRIEKIYNKFAYIRHFDADGVWQDEPYRIPYTEITSVTFSSRYLNIFSKYVGEPPEHF